MKDELPPALGRYSRAAVVIGILSLAVSAIGWVVSPRPFFFAWLVAELVWLGVSLGCMAFLMMHYLTGGRWGWPVRRFFEAAAGTLPLLALLFVPIIFGIRFLYPWANEKSVAANPVLEHKHPYLNLPLFIVRAVVIFGVWICIAFFCNRWSRQQDESHDVGPLKKLRTLSGPGLIIYPFTLTFAFVDWVMSLEADWYSTMFPVLACIGQMLGGLAFIILLLAWLGPRSALSQVIGKENFHHLGNLLLAFTMMWAYLAFGQLIIIWSGDLPHEIVWYLHRIAGGWRWVVTFLVLFHFFGPFFLLLSRRKKQNRIALASIAGVIFVAHIVDVWWIVTPSFATGGVYVTWLNFTTLTGIGGLWFALFVHNLERKALLPVNDPRFALATTL
jgi:hypothetical protein